MHSEWEEFSKHEVVSMEQIQSNMKQLVPPKKVTLYCSLHEGMKLDLYCKTCGELICLHCTVKKHKDHQYDLVGDTFERHKAEITTSLEPVEKKLGVVSKALEQFNIRLQELDNLQVATEDTIQQQIQQLHDLLEARKAELIGQLQQYIQTKKKNLLAQKDEVETVHTQLASCLSFIKESLRIGSQGEVMKMKKAVVKQIKEMTGKFKLDMLPPCELANVKFIACHDHELTQACQQFGMVFLQQTSPQECYATGKGLEVAKVDKETNAVLHIVGHKGKAYTKQVVGLTCELVSKRTCEKIDCFVKKIFASGQYKISYQATSQGKHQLHIKVEGDHINGSPSPVNVIRKLGTPIKIIRGMTKPSGVAVNQRGKIIVAEDNEHCISIFKPSGDKLRSFGSYGSGQGQFWSPWGVAVDDDGNLLVTEQSNHRIQMLTSAGKFIKAVSRTESKPLEFNQPMGIVIHPLNKMVYVVDRYNYRVQILNPDLTFFSSFGRRGRFMGEFYYPWGIACDSTGNVYVTDNHSVQVFTADGLKCLRKFGDYGSGNGELSFPTSISIDSDDVVYITEQNNHRVSVFTCEGKFLTSFGTVGSGPGEFDSPRGIAVDKNGVIYVTDTGNNRLQLF